MEDLKLSHVGIIVSDLKQFGGFLNEVLSVQVESPIVEDKNQQAFLQMFKSGSCCLELISPNSESSNVNTAINHFGDHLAHLCFETSDLEATLKRIRDKGVLVFRPPTPAVLFDQKKVAFALLPNKIVVEFAEREKV